MAGSKGSKYYDIFLDYSVSLNHRKEGKVIGSDSFSLLNEIHSTASLKEAAEMLGISYRKAWGIIQGIEEALGLKLVHSQRGGTQGGETRLTEEGLKLIRAHKELKEEFDKSIHSMTRKFFHEVNN